MDPSSYHNEVYSTTNTVELNNFAGSLKVPDWVNWIKGVYEKHEKNSAFGIITDPLPMIT